MTVWILVLFIWLVSGVPAHTEVANQISWNQNGTLNSALHHTWTVYLHDAPKLCFCEELSEINSLTTMTSTVRWLWFKYSINGN